MYQSKPIPDSTNRNNTPYDQENRPKINNSGQDEELKLLGPLFLIVIGIIGLIIGIAEIRKEKNQTYKKT